MSTDRPPKPLDTSEMTSKQLTHEALLEAGMELFAKHGFDAPSLVDICDRAGYSRGAFHAHFRSRDEFVAEIVERLVDGYIRGVLPSPQDMAQDFEAYVRGFAERAMSGMLALGPESHLKLHHLLDAGSRDKRARGRLEVLVARIAEHIEKAMRAAGAIGFLRTDVDAEVLAKMFVAIAIGVQASKDAGVQFPVPAFADAMLHLLRADTTRR